MQRTIITPKDESHWLSLRAEDITSTEVSALFDLNPYMSAFELWHLKNGTLESEFKVNERMVWGNRLQEAIAVGVATDHNLAWRTFNEYMKLEGLRIGSSFDYRVHLFNGETEAYTDTDNDAILEIKNVDALQFKQKWVITEDAIEAPPHIELQVQHQMLVSGLNKAYIAALIGGNDVKLLERDADPEIHEAILTRCGEFWASIDAGKEPEPDFEKDAAVFLRLNQYAEPGKFYDGRSDQRLKDLADMYTHHKEEIKHHDAIIEEVKAEIISIIGDCEKATGEGFTISAGLVGPSHVEYDRKGYRNFRVNRPRGKKDDS